MLLRVSPSAWRYHFTSFGGTCRKYSKLNVLFFGLDDFSCQVFKRLQAHPDIWESLTIATKADQYIGRGREKLFVSPLKKLALTQGYPIVTIPDTRDAFRSWNPPAPFSPTTNSPDPANVLVTASFGRILPARLLSLFASTRCINVHPSALPAYRGPAPIQRALMNGEAETGVSIIEMTKVMSRAKRLASGTTENGIDAGNILSLQHMSIPDHADFTALRDALAHAGGDLLVDVLRKMLNGSLLHGVAQPPPNPETPRAPLILPEEAFVDFTSMSATEITRLHRAISHQKPLTAFLETPLRREPLRVQLHNPTVLHNVPTADPSLGWFDKASGLLLVCCRDQTVLAIPRLKTDSRALLEAKEWWNGAPRASGIEKGRKHVRFVTPPAQV